MRAAVVSRREDRVAELPAVLGVTTSLTAVLDAIDIVGRRNALLRAVQAESTWAMRAFWRGSWPVLTL